MPRDQTGHTELKLELKRRWARILFYVIVACGIGEARAIVLNVPMLFGALIIVRRANDYAFLSNTAAMPSPPPTAIATRA